MVGTPPADLVAEAKRTEEKMLKLRREVWSGGEITSRDVLDVAMRTCDFLCKLSSRADKERNRDVAHWIAQTRRSMRAMLREYWLDILEQRRAVYEPAAEGSPNMIPVR
jgi:hypothetical protein